MLTQPFDVVKTRLQAASSTASSAASSAATALPRYASTAQCFRQIVRDEGVATLYSGTAARCARVVPGSGIIFMSADATYNVLARRRERRDEERRDEERRRAAAGARAAAGDGAAAGSREACVSHY